MCTFGHFRCVSARSMLKNVTIQSYGACLNFNCSFKCNSNYEPVCATTGKTFPNKCELQRSICTLNSSNENILAFDYRGK